MTIGERIREKLAAALAPTRLDVVDESHMHAGHAGARADFARAISVCMSRLAGRLPRPVNRNRLESLNAFRNGL